MNVKDAVIVACLEALAKDPSAVVDLGVDVVVASAEDFVGIVAVDWH